eukprot:scaffold90277_cov16-Tisochrysis_lutea.AAC.1
MATEVSSSSHARTPFSRKKPSCSPLVMPVPKLAMFMNSWNVPLSKKQDSVAKAFTQALPRACERPGDTRAPAANAGGGCGGGAVPPPADAKGSFAPVSATAAVAGGGGGGGG